MILFIISIDYLGICMRECTKQEQQDKPGGSAAPRGQVTVDQDVRLAETGMKRTGQILDML